MAHYPSISFGGPPIKKMSILQRPCKEMDPPINPFRLTRVEPLDLHINDFVNTLKQADNRSGVYSLRCNDGQGRPITIERPRSPRLDGPLPDPNGILYIGGCDKMHDRAPTMYGAICSAFKNAGIIPGSGGEVWHKHPTGIQFTYHPEYLWQFPFPQLFVDIYVFHDFPLNSAVASWFENYHLTWYQREFRTKPLMNTRPPGSLDFPPEESLNCLRAVGKPIPEELIDDLH
jgi:hypothetical protein